MTDTRHSRCLDSRWANMLAEYIDGGLDPRERAEVEAHLAECGECYENFAEAVRASGVAIAVGPVMTPAARRRRPAYFVMAAAAAVLVVAAGVATQWLGRGGDPLLTELADAVGDRRPVLPRLTGGFLWGTPPAVTRGPNDIAPTSGAVTIAIGKIETALERDRTATTLRDHAIAEMVLGRADSAVDALKEAAAIAPKDSHVWSNLAAAYLMRSASGDHASDLPAGYDAASTALAIDPRLAEALFNRALILERMELRDRAADDWHAFLKIDGSSKWADEARAHLAALSKTSALLAPSDSSANRLRFLESELPRWAEAASRGTASADALLASMRQDPAVANAADRFVADVVGNLTSAIRADHRAASRLAAGVAAFSAAEANWKARDRVSAEREYVRARQVLQPFGNPLALAAAGRLAELRDDDAARRAFLASIADRKYPSLAAAPLWSLGMSAHAAGQFADAEEKYRAARDAYAAADDAAGTKTLDGQIASLADELGLLDAAWRDRLVSFTGLSVRPRTRQHQALLMTGAFWSARADWPYVALLCSRESIEIARELGDAVGLADTLTQQALSLERLGHHADAVASANEARTLIAPSIGPRFASLSAKLAMADALLNWPTPAGAVDRASAAAEYYASIKEASRLPEALALKANRLRAIGNVEQARETLALGLAEVSALRKSSGSASIPYADRGRPLIDEFVDLSIAQGRTAEAFDALEKARAIASDSTLTLPQIQTRLAPHATLIVYSLQRSKVTMFRVRQRDVKVAHADIDGFALNRLVSAFADRPTPALGAALRALLIDPVLADDSSSDAVGIVPDGVLHRLPFAALPGLTSRFLIEERSITFGLSATSVAARIGHTYGRDFLPRRMIAVGASQFDRVQYPKLATLPQSDAEARMVASALPGATSRVGGAATRDALLDALGRADGLHFSGHAIADEIRPERSALVASGRAGSQVTAAQIAAMNLTHMRLAVLAACETASGAISRTAGPLSIVRSMISAGVGTVVASRTPLDDAASMRLFRYFYNALAKTNDPARALQQAQVAMIDDADRAFSDPVRWSGVVVLSGSERAHESLTLAEARRRR